jgi:cytochrome c oxidase subunit 2
MKQFAFHFADFSIHSWLPPQASTIASSVDGALSFISLVSIFFTVVIGLILIFLCLKYKKKTDDDYTPNLRGSRFWETVWTIAPTILVGVIFFIALFPYLQTQKIDPAGYEINVTGKKWMWDFDYSNGKKTFNELYLPVNKPVRLVMTSEDVLHSFYIPAFRVKQDVVGNMYTFLNFTPNKVGDYVIYCAEYCGVAHSDMKGIVHVLSEEDFYAWETGSKNSKKSVVASSNLKQQGKDLYLKNGCNACHSVDGSSGMGPTWKGLFGKKREFEDGTSSIVDENYLRTSIEIPSTKIVKGYQPVMPAYKGVLTDKEITSMIEYIKALR